VSSAFERETKSAKEKREQRETRINSDRAEKRAKSDPILSPINFCDEEEEEEEEEERNETKRAHLVQQNVRVFRRERERCNHRRSEDAKE
jgi:hypothetical protein